MIKYSTLPKIKIKYQIRNIFSLKEREREKVKYF